MAAAQPAPQLRPTVPLGPGRNRESQTWGRHLLSTHEEECNRLIVNRSASVVRLKCDNLDRPHWREEVEESRRRVGVDLQLPCGAVTGFLLTTPHSDADTIFGGVGRYLDLQTAFRNRDAGDIVAPPFEDLRFMFMCTPLNSCFILGAPVDELNRWMLLPYGTYYLAREHQDAVVIGNQNNSPFDKERMVCAQHGLYYSPEVDGSYNGILVRVRECFVKVGFRTLTDEFLWAVRFDVTMQTIWGSFSKFMTSWPDSDGICRDEETHETLQVAGNHHPADHWRLHIDWRRQHSREFGAGWFVSCKIYPDMDIFYPFGSFFKAPAGRWAPTTDELAFRIMEGHRNDIRYRYECIFFPGGLYQPAQEQNLWWRVPIGFIVLDTIMPTVMASHNWLVVDNEPVPMPGTNRALNAVARGRRTLD